ncbi:MAG: hypothetical protein IPJ13_01475 [Saprospiraceae bacterium]|nr:hypothetical protein [Saprospiraceae bacterium]
MPIVFGQCPRVEKKTNIKDIDEHEITVATRSLEVQPEDHPYNDFQEDLNELVNNMNGSHG